MQNDDTVIFCFGEIDCRCHVHKHVTTEKSYREIIENLVQEYIKAIEISVNTSGLTFKNVCIFNVVPPVQRHNTGENPEYPYLGSDEDRKGYVLYFNSLLKSHCSIKQFVYFDVYDKYCDINGFLRKDLSDGNVHITDFLKIIHVPILGNTSTKKSKIPNQSFVIVPQFLLPPRYRRYCGYGRHEKESWPFRHGLPLKAYSSYFFFENLVN